jgi:hypothetical protein
MPRATWTLDIDHGQHTVMLEYGTWSGRRILTVDGVTVDRRGSWLGLWSEQAFSTGTCKCYVRTRPLSWRAWSLVVELHHAGRVLPPTSVTP